MACGEGFIAPFALSPKELAESNSKSVIGERSMTFDLIAAAPGGSCESFRSLCEASFSADACAPITAGVNGLYVLTISREEDGHVEGGALFRLLHGSGVLSITAHPSVLGRVAEYQHIFDLGRSAIVLDILLLCVEPWRRGEGLGAALMRRMHCLLLNEVPEPLPASQHASQAPCPRSPIVPASRHASQAPWPCSDHT